MKAGIYKRRDTDRLIYVAKDRSVRAFESCADTFRSISTEGWKVSAQQKEQVGTWPMGLGDGTEGGYGFADRVADAPNGCTDHAQALADYAKWRPRTGQEVLEDIDATFDTNYAAQVENHLADHPPEQRVEQPDTDWTIPEPATPDFAERAQAQVDIVNAYERAKRDLQVLLHAEQVGAVQWENGDWTILDLSAWDAIADAPPRLLPVLPTGWVAERAKQYKGSSGRHRWALAAAQGTGGRYHAGGFDLKPGEVPVILTRGEERHLGKPLALGARYAVGSETLTVRINATGCTSEEQAKLLAGKYRGVYQDAASLLWPTPRPLPVTGRPMPAGTKRHGAVGVAAQTPNELTVIEMIEAGRARIVGKQSARKHRRAGRAVFWFAPLGSRVVIV